MPFNAKCFPLLITPLSLLIVSYFCCWESQSFVILQCHFQVEGVVEMPITKLLRATANPLATKKLCVALVQTDGDYGSTMRIANVQLNLTLNGRAVSIPFLLFSVRSLCLKVQLRGFVFFRTADGTCAPLSSAPAHGSLGSCGSVLPHGGSCSIECAQGYELTEPMSRTCSCGMLSGDGRRLDSIPFALTTRIPCRASVRGVRAVPCEIRDAAGAGQGCAHPGCTRRPRPR